MLYLKLYDIEQIDKSKLREYVNFIESCKYKELPDYTESHHILPKSLFPDFRNDKNNIIKLSPEDHYKAHAILAELYGGGMLNAFNLMRSRLGMSADEYGHLRREYSKHMSREMYDRWADPEYKSRLSAINKKAWEDEDRRLNTSKHMLLEWSCPIKRNARIENICKMTQTDDFRDKISEISKDSWKDDTIRDKRLKAMAVTMQTKEYKEKHSNNQKERMKDPALRAKCGWNRGKGRPARTCPHCGRSGNKLDFFRTHFSNCKKIRDLRGSFIRVHLLYLETLKDENIKHKNLCKQHLNKFIIGFKHLKY